MNIRQWCEQAQPVYELYGWEIYNHDTGKMEIPTVAKLEEVVWDLIGHLQYGLFAGGCRIAVTRGDALSVLPCGSSNHIELSLMYESFDLTEETRPAKQLALF